MRKRNGDIHRCGWVVSCEGTELVVLCERSEVGSVSVVCRRLFFVVRSVVLLFCSCNEFLDCRSYVGRSRLGGLIR